MNKSNNDNTEVVSQSEDLGVLLFAFDNQQINYMELAAACATRVRDHWKLPVSIVTDIEDVDYNLFDKRILIQKSTMETNSKIYVDYGTDLQFWNGNRVLALDLTPYRRTILMDVDLLVQTDEIPRLWNGEHFAITNKAYSVFEWQKLSTDMQVLSQSTQIPMAWATVVCFDKESEWTQKLFTEWKKALKGYPVYAHKMGFSPKPVRNDFAISIALYKLLDGHYQGTRFELPYEIPSLMPESHLLKVEDDCLYVSTKEGATTAIYSDLHVMNKKSILECLHHFQPNSMNSTEPPAQVF